MSITKTPLEWLTLSEPEARCFWSKVSQPDPVTGCMEWLESLTPSGYALFRLRRGTQRHIVRLGSHRIAFVLSGGRLEPDEVVDHTCSNRACQNPTHLRAATAGENLQHRDPATIAARSGVRGVFPDRQKWRAQVQVDRRVVSVGSFSSIEEAERAVTAARLRLMPFAHPEMREAL